MDYKIKYTGINYLFMVTFNQQPRKKYIFRFTFKSMKIKIFLYGNT